MKNLILLVFIVGVGIGCNTRFGSNEPTTDSRANPAELAVDSVGANTDIPGSAATDSNKTGEPMQAPGKSDLQVGGDDGSNKTMSSDGNIIDENKNNTNQNNQ